MVLEWLHSATLCRFSLLHLKKCHRTLPPFPERSHACKHVSKATSAWLSSDRSSETDAARPEALTSGGQKHFWRPLGNKSGSCSPGRHVGARPEPSRPACLGGTRARAPRGGAQWTVGAGTACGHSRVTGPVPVHPWAPHDPFHLVSFKVS